MNEFSLISKYLKPLSLNIPGALKLSDTFNSRNKSKIISLSKKLNTKISKIGFIKKEKKIVFRYNMNKLILNTKKMEYIHNF